MDVQGGRIVSDQAACSPSWKAARLVRAESVNPHECSAEAYVRRPDSFSKSEVSISDGIGLLNARHS